MFPVCKYNERKFSLDGPSEYLVMRAWEGEKKSTMENSMETECVKIDLKRGDTSHIIFFLADEIP